MLCYIMLHALVYIPSQHVQHGHEAHHMWVLDRTDTFWLCSQVSEQPQPTLELHCVMQSVFIYWVTSNTWSFLQSMGEQCKQL